MASYFLEPPGIPLLERRLSERDSYSKAWLDACATLPLVQLLHSRLMTHRIHIKLQITGKSQLIFNLCGAWLPSICTLVFLVCTIEQHVPLVLLLVRGSLKGFLMPYMDY